MKHGSLFSGIGGFDLAAEWMGWENLFHCEWNEFGQKILKHYWPNAESYEDITKTDFSIHRGKIDILTGGFPCQPYSHAGKRLGKEDDRHLWPEMLRAIREIQPRWVVGENVSGLVSWNGGMVFDEVQNDLENEGYEVQPIILPAAAVNAPHRRDRVWFIAYREGFRWNGGGSEQGESVSNEKRKVYKYRQEWGKMGGESKRHSEKRPTPNPQDIQRNTEREKGKQCGTGGQTWSRVERTSSEGITADTVSRLDTREKHRQKESGQPTKTNPGLRWSNFPTQSPICSRNDGVSSRLDGITFPKWRNESIKAAGNAIVPQVAYEIFKVIQQMDEIKQTT